MSYFTRALTAADRRYARIAERIGLKKKMPTPKRALGGPVPAPEEISAPASNGADVSAVESEIGQLRAIYERLYGKRPFMGWDAEKLRAKIAESGEGCA